MKLKLKNIISLCLLSGAVVFSSCSMNLLSKPHETETPAAPVENIETGEIIIKAGNTSRGFTKDDIVSAKIVISYPEETIQENVTENIPIQNGTLTEDLRIKDLRFGYNRIVSVIPYDKNGNELHGTIRAITNIIPGDRNVVFVSKQSTSYANVLYTLKDSIADKLANPDKSFRDELEELKKCIDDSVDPALFDYVALAENFNKQHALGTSAQYIKKTGSYTFDYYLNEDFTIHVNDPISRDVHYQHAGSNRTITDIAPGIWTVTILDKNGNVLESDDDVKIMNGEDVRAQHFKHNGVAVIMEPINKYNRIWFYHCSNKEIQEVEWQNTSPGFEITKTVVCDGPNDPPYHMYYNFEDTSGVSFVIANPTGFKLLDDECTAREKGVWKVEETGYTQLTPSKLPDVFNPDDYNFTQENFEELYYDDSKNQRFIMIFNPEIVKYDQVIKGIEIGFNKGVSDYKSFYGNTYEFGYYNGKYQGKDIELWYTFVPYEDLKCPNTSGVPTYRIKINGINWNAAAFLSSNNHDDHIYKYYYNKTPQYTLPVIIKNDSKRESTLRRINISKYAKEDISDFGNCVTLEQQMMLCNFRRVPGTTNLYRSYHPFQSAKSFMDVEPYRMYYLGILGEKFGIKSDINISGDTNEHVTKTVTVYDGVGSCNTIENYMPEYYKKIAPENIYVQMKDTQKFSYNLIYYNPFNLSSSNFSDTSKQIAFAMGKIIQFIGTHEGPYQIHCAIGTDRTGVACAMLAALCNASWDQIEEDYCASADTGIYEHRGPGLIQNTFEQFLEVSDITTVTNLRTEVASRIKHLSGITQDEIDLMVKNLTK